MQAEQKVNVLMVDDHPENLLALEAVLGSLGENLVRATSGEEALRCSLHQEFAVILLDVQMPGMDGFETATLIRARERSQHTPIIFLTAFSTSDQFVFKGYSLGAVDYLFKPIEPEILKSKVAVFIDLFKKTAEVERQALQLQAINAELKKNEVKFRSLSACSPVGIFTLDIESRCTYKNSRCQTICNFTLDESYVGCISKLAHPEDRERAIANWLAYTRNGLEYLDEFRCLSPKGANVRWVQVRSSPMLSEQGKPLGHVGTVEDITERKIAEEERGKLIREQAARKEAEATNRMKDEFLATLSHELRTPLTAILGWTAMLRTRNFNEDTIARALETIERNAKSQAQLIEDILDVSRIIQGKLRLTFCPVNLVAVTEAALDAIRPAADAKSIECRFSILDLGMGHGKEDRSNLNHHPLPIPKLLVSGDPNRLQQVLWNLLSNAIKFTPEGGKVEVRLSAVMETGKENASISDAITLVSTTQNSLSYAQISVIDTGIGIEPEFLPHVFERFRQADGTTTRAYGGLGLGLAIVRHLVVLHRGTVQADSNGEGQGSTFIVKLPLLEKSFSATGDSKMESKECEDAPVEERQLWSKPIGERENKGNEGKMDISFPSSPNFFSLDGTHPLSSFPFREKAGAASHDRLRSENAANEIVTSYPEVPAQLTIPEVASPPEPQSSLPTLSGLQVLVVDDDVDSCELLSIVLKEYGCQVTTVASVSEALKALEQLQPDILLSDIGMPDEDGYALIRQVRSFEAARGGFLPAVALTAYVRQEDYTHALEAGFQRHLSKPVDLGKLVTIVAELVGRNDEG